MTNRQKDRYMYRETKDRKTERLLEGQKDRQDSFALLELVYLHFCGLECELEYVFKPKLTT